MTVLFAGLRTALRRTIEVVAIVGLLLMVIVLAGQVFTRYVLNDPWVWSEEFSRYVFVWLVYLGATLALTAKAHLGLGIWNSVRGTRAGKLVATIREGIMAAFLIMLLFSAYQVVPVVARQTSPMLGLSLGVIYMAPTAMAILSLVDIALRWAQRLVGQEEETA